MTRHQYGDYQFDIYLDEASRKLLRWPAFRQVSIVAIRGVDGSRRAAKVGELFGPTMTGSSPGGDD
jgi:hypothetical protein